MRNTTKFIILILLSLGAIAGYLFHDLNGSFDYALPKRVMKVAAMILTGVAIAYSTVIFQTITHNRILTPSIMGLDSLYILLQTVLIFFFGSTSAFIINSQLNLSLIHI